MHLARILVRAGSGHDLASENRDWCDIICCCISAVVAGYRKHANEIV